MKARVKGRCFNIVSLSNLQDEETIKKTKNTDERHQQKQRTIAAVLKI